MQALVLPKNLIFLCDNGSNLISLFCYVTDKSQWSLPLKFLQISSTPSHLYTIVCAPPFFKGGGLKILAMRHYHLDTRSHVAVLNNRFGLQIGRSRFAPVSPLWKPRGAFLDRQAHTWKYITLWYNYQQNPKILCSWEGTLVRVFTVNIYLHIDAETKGGLKKIIIRRAQYKRW